MNTSCLIESATSFDLNNYHEECAAAILGTFYRMRVPLSLQELRDNLLFDRPEDFAQFSLEMYALEDQGILKWDIRSVMWRLIDITKADPALLRKATTTIPEGPYSNEVILTLQYFDEPMTFREIARNSSLSQREARFGIWALFDAGKVSLTKMNRVRLCPDAQLASISD